jgi:DNA-binding CsgD family transcriptional regulator
MTRSTELNPRELLVTQLYADGKSMQQIADEMQRTIFMVKRDFVGIRRKLGAQSTANAVAISIRRGLID